MMAPILAGIKQRSAFGFQRRSSAALGCGDAMREATIHGEASVDFAAEADRHYIAHHVLATKDSYGGSLGKSMG
jgi:hypothetical protein